MMKRMMVLFLAILMVFVSAAALADDHQTAFDTYSQWRGYEEITAPVYPQTKNAGEIAGNDEEIVNFLARAWYNMLAYETEVKGTKLKDTMAAEIYTGIKKGPGISVFTACDPEAICMNAFFAFDMYAYWIEWNLDTQHIRFYKAFGVDQQKNDAGYLSDYVTNSLLAASMEGNAIFGSKSETAVYEAYGTKTQLYKLFEAAYKQATGKTFSIK